MLPSGLSVAAHESEQWATVRGSIEQSWRHLHKLVVELARTVTAS
jgi:hypothetical protein